MLLWALCITVTGSVAGCQAQEKHRNKAQLRGNGKPQRKWTSHSERMCLEFLACGWPVGVSWQPFAHLPSDSKLSRHSHTELKGASVLLQGTHLGLPNSSPKSPQHEKKKKCVGGFSPILHIEFLNVHECKRKQITVSSPKKEKSEIYNVPKP